MLKISEKVGPDRVDWGCAIFLLIANIGFLGLLALALAQGPYSSFEQKVWYRYGTLSLLLAGVVLPGFLLVLKRQSRRGNGTACGLMGGTFVLAIFYGVMSGGGV